MRRMTYSWGAVPVGNGRWRVRLWAPGVKSLGLRLNGTDHPMAAVGDGWHEIEASGADGDPYIFVLPDGSAVPDPAARRQEGDVHGPSLLTAPPSDDPLGTWNGRPWEEAVIYELHVGTFTEGGTFRSAIERLDHVAGAGFTCIEIMPVAQFAGNRGWGYDGVLPYAPHPAYGTPDDFRSLIRAAHDRGLMVKLDVVYNHFGPVGDYMGSYAPAFYDTSRETAWGEAFDFTAPPVRRFFIENALYWLAEYGLDGLRLDAIDNIRDETTPHVLIEMAQEIRATFPDRHIHTATEDESNTTRFHERDGGKVALHTAEWNDDLHNVAHVIATGETEGYYADFAEKEWTLYARALAEGYAYQGERTMDGTPRGEPSAHMPPVAFVDFLQNHDQIGNRAFGERLPLLAEPAMVEALTAALLLSPHIPLMFMGEEFGSTRPFCFFADFEGDMARAVTEGRRREFAKFAAFSRDPDTIPDPIAASTFEASRIDWAEADHPENNAREDFVRELLDLRARRLVPHLAGTGGNAGRVLMADSGAIAVDWKLDGALLQLRARLADGAPEGLPSSRGELLVRAGATDAAPWCEMWLEETS